MKRILFLFVVAFLVGCSSSTTSAPPPTSCDPATQRVGTYSVHYDLVSGDCGAIPDEDLVLTSAAGPSSGGCMLNAEVDSPNGCKFNRDTTCPYPRGGTTRTTGETTQDTADGSELSGSVTLTITGTPNGSCVGTYDLTATRL